MQQHELGDVADVPSPRHRQILGIDIVGRDGGLREVVQQIVGQHLDRRHRQERQEDAGAEHAEHVAEIRAGAHLDVFGDVAEDLAALDHAVAEHRQALLQEDDVGRFLGDVDGAVDRDADVGGLERRAVVDAVAQIADHVPVAVQRIDDRRLLRRRDLGEHRRGLGQAANCSASSVSISPPSTMRSTGRPTSWQILRVTMSLSPVRILTCTPLALSVAMAAAAGLLRRIEERDVAHEGEAGLVGDRIGGLRRRHLLAGDRDHPEPVGVEVGGGLLGGGEMARIERAGLAADGIVRAGREHLLDRALADQDMGAVVAGEHDRHPPPLEVERHLVDLLVPGLDLEAARRARHA